MSSTCSICRCDFDLDTEGGVEGCIGIIPVSFCPPCREGIYDFACQAFALVPEDPLE